MSDDSLMLPSVFAHQQHLLQNGVQFPLWRDNAINSCLPFPFSSACGYPSLMFNHQLGTPNFFGSNEGLNLVNQFLPTRPQLDSSASSTLAADPCLSSETESQDSPNIESPVAEDDFLSILAAAADQMAELENSCDKVDDAEETPEVRPQGQIRKKKNAKKPFVCKHCGATYTSATALQTHIYRHSGERPFQCRYCTKSFRSKFSVDSHERYHTGEKPFQCRVCGQRFTIAASLQYHAKNPKGAHDNPLSTADDDL